MNFFSDKKLILTQLKGDISGGIISAIISIPSALAYGIMAFAPLGPEYMSLGAISGLICSIFNTSISSIAGGTPAMISGPKASITLITSSIISRIILNLDIDLNSMEAVYTVIALTFFLLFVAAVIQMLFGLFRFGSLIKYTPYPTIAGFINGTALLILLSQIWIVLGLKQPTSILHIFDNTSDIQILSIVVAVITVGSIIVPNFLNKRIPGPLTGLLVGTSLYYGFYFLGFSENLGPVIGKLEITHLSAKYMTTFIDIIKNYKANHLFYLLPTSFILAVLMSIDSLVNSLAVESTTLKKTNANRELIGQGLGNMVSAALGGLSGAGTSSRAFANIRAGATSKISGLFAGLMVLATALFLNSVIRYIPNVVMAGILIAIAYLMVDRWSLKLFGKIIEGAVTDRFKAITSFSTILIVTLVAVTIDMIVAVVVGSVMSIFLLISTISQSVISRRFSGGSYFSRKQRDHRFIDILMTEGKKIEVFELVGYIFFSSADGLACEVEKFSEGKKFIILDIKQIRNIDITGAKVLEKINKRLKTNDIDMLISYLEEGSPNWNFLQDMGILDMVGEKQIFSSTDDALEFAEDHLINDFILASLSKTDKEGHTLQDNTFKDLYNFQFNEIPLHEIKLLEGLDDDEIKIVDSITEKKTFTKGEYLVHQGDMGDSLFIIAEGLCEVTLDLENAKKSKRLLASSSGTILGEMSLIDKKPRSANLIAGENLICYILDSEKFEALKKEHPHISIQLLENISKELSNRLRIAHTMISELEQK